MHQLNASMHRPVTEKRNRVIGPVGKINNNPTLNKKDLSPDMIITNRKIKERIYMQKQTTKITINLRKEQIANHCPLILRSFEIRRASHVTEN